MAKKLGKGKKVVTVSPDGAEKYLSTDVFKQHIILKNIKNRIGSKQILVRHWMILH